MSAATDNQVAEAAHHRRNRNICPTDGGIAVWRPLLPAVPGVAVVKALELWRQQVLAPQARAALRAVIEARRNDPDDHDACDALLEVFMGMLTEEQLAVFSRVLRELTEVVH